MDVEKLNDERKKLKISVAELAERANLPKGTVEKILFGIVKNPRVDTMRAIENALKFSTQNATWTEQERSLGVGNHATHLSDEEWEWLELGSEIQRVMGEDYLNTVKAMLQAIIEKK